MHSFLQRPAVLAVLETSPLADAANDAATRADSAGNSPGVSIELDETEGDADEDATEQGGGDAILEDGEDPPRAKCCPSSRSSFYIPSQVVLLLLLLQLLGSTRFFYKFLPREAIAGAPESKAFAYSWPCC